MTLIQRGKTWHTRIEFQGRVYQRSLMTKNKNEAITRESALRMALQRGEFGLADHSQIPTLEGFEKQFFKALESKVAKRSLDFYKDAWRPLLRFEPLGKAKLYRIDKALIEQFVQKRLKEVRPATVNHSLRTLRRALRLAQEWKLIQQPPRIRMLPGERQREFVIDEDTLFNMGAYFRQFHPDSVMQYLLPFLVDTGLRISEACNLKEEHVSFDPKPEAQRGYVYVEKGKSKFAKRYVPLTERAVENLRAMLSLSRCEYVVVPDDRTRKMTRHYPSQLFNKAKTAMALPWDCVLHSTRHTFCTRLGESGCDAFTIQKLAGHSSITISQRYVHPTSRIAENAIAHMEEIRRQRAALAEKKENERIQNLEEIAAKRSLGKSAGSA